MSDVVISTLSAKGQTTIPVAIRRLLKIEPGDAIKYEADGEAVRIQKAEKMDLQWARALEATLTEWTDEADDDL